MQINQSINQSKQSINQSPIQCTILKSHFLSLPGGKSPNPVSEDLSTCTARKQQTHHRMHQTKKKTPKPFCVKLKGCEMAKSSNSSDFFFFLKRPPKMLFFCFLSPLFASSFFSSFFSFSSGVLRNQIKPPNQNTKSDQNTKFPNLESRFHKKNTHPERARRCASSIDSKRIAGLDDPLQNNVKHSKTNKTNTTKANNNNNKSKANIQIQNNNNTKPIKSKSKSNYKQQNKTLLETLLEHWAACSSSIDQEEQKLHKTKGKNFFAISSLFQTRTFFGHWNSFPQLRT
jgi:hypothetical protein